MSAKTPVFSTFIGPQGSQFTLFNRTQPFPPKPGSRGFIALGWSGVGDMSAYENDYASFQKAFERLYGEKHSKSKVPKRSLSIAAGKVWTFFSEISIGDGVLTAVTEDRYRRALLLGKVIGEYQFDGYPVEGGPLFPGRRADLAHFREVHWEIVIEEKEEKALYKEMSKYLSRHSLSRVKLDKESLTSLVKRSRSEGSSS